MVAGTILKSGVNTGAATWNTSGLIEGTGQSYSLLNLVSDGSGDQIYAFEADNFPPLFHPSNHIFLLDFGDNLNPGFETASSSSTGDAPSELTIGNTAVTLPDPAFGDDDNDFHNGSFALNMADPDVVALNTSVTPVTKAQWLAVIANSDNWLQYNYVGSDVDAESQLGALNFAGVPEPSRALLLALGGCIAGIRRRRKTA